MNSSERLKVKSKSGKDGTSGKGYKARKAARREKLKTLQAIDDDLVTSWSVLTEAFYMLEDWKTGQANLWNFIMAGAVQLYEIQPLHYGRLEELMRKYSDRPMDLADATIVLIAESLKIRTLFTLDKKDFSIYHPKHCRHFEIIPE